MDFTATITWSVEFQADNLEAGQAHAIAMAEKLSQPVYIDDELYTGEADVECLQYTDDNGCTYVDQWVKEGAIP